jgi:hypothetical protein
MAFRQVKLFPACFRKYFLNHKKQIAMSLKVIGSGVGRTRALQAAG